MHTGNIEPVDHQRKVEDEKTEVTISPPVIRDAATNGDSFPTFRKITSSGSVFYEAHSATIIV